VTDRLGFASEDRTVPAVVYGLYLLGLTHGLTIIIGLIVAYASQDGAGSRMRTHYTFQIRTFWLSIVWFLVGVALIVFGAPLVLAFGLGLLVMGLGWMICGAVWLWFLARCVLGAIYLARDEPYPRPYSLML
jgi:uncharacterized membrane protein